LRNIGNRSGRQLIPRMINSSTSFFRSIDRSSRRSGNTATWPSALIPKYPCPSYGCVHIRESSRPGFMAFIRSSPNNPLDRHDSKDTSYAIPPELQQLLSIPEKNSRPSNNQIPSLWSSANSGLCVNLLSVPELNCSKSPRKILPRTAHIVNKECRRFHL